jgi:hypothetical protein
MGTRALENFMTEEFVVCRETEGTEMRYGSVGVELNG